jgi:hypothetical protein
MLQPQRDDFNARFTPQAYDSLIESLNRAARTDIEFRICETPCFFPLSLMEEMAETGRILTNQLLDNPEYMQASNASIPERYRVPNENPIPNFMTVDFGLARDAEGKLTPKLVEMQAFPSVFGYQELLARQYIEIYHLDPGLQYLLGSYTEQSYWDLLRHVIVGEHDPKQVVLAEVEPESQKTLPDFNIHEDRLGIAIVDIAKLRKQGRDLLYECDGKWIPIKRIYNRAIVDEIERKGVTLPFDYRDDLSVEWAGHPNWFFRISKFSLPYLDHPSVPSALFLDDFLAGRDLHRLPADRERLLLKPLYSFAGKGIQFAPTDADLAAIPLAERSNYLVQERIDFTPVIVTPHGLTQAEIRILYVWPDGGEMQPVITLARLGRGKMMGVDHNRDQQWVGGSAVLCPS